MQQLTGKGSSSLDRVNNGANLGSVGDRAHLKSLRHLSASWVPTSPGLWAQAQMNRWEWRVGFWRDSWKSDPEYIAQSTPSQPRA